MSEEQKTEIMEPQQSQIKDSQIYSDGLCCASTMLACMDKMKEDNCCLKKENARLKECLRPRDPETELPPDRKFVIVMDRPRDLDGMTCSFFHFAFHVEGKWRTDSKAVVYPVAWWPLPDNEGSEI